MHASKCTFCIGTDKIERKIVYSRVCCSLACLQLLSGCRNLIVCLKKLPFVLIVVVVALNQWNIKITRVSREQENLFQEIKYNHMLQHVNILYADNN